MKSWLKFISLSFFSDKIANEAPKRGYGNLFLAAVLAIVFMALGMMGATFLPFSSFYHRSSDFRATVEKLLVSDDSRVSIAVADGVLSADAFVDTVSNEADAAKYSAGGYDVVVDTRPSGLYDDFTAYCVSNSGAEITYEEYLGLNDDMKTLYTFRIRYSGKELVLDGDAVAKYESYLDGVTEREITDAYKELKKTAGSGYASALYELYVKAYYPDLSAYETQGAAPKLRNFYFHNYFERETILFVFDDSIIGRFATDGGIPITFYGFFDDMPDGTVEPTAQGMEDFIVDSFASSVPLMIYANMSGFFSVVPFVILIVVLLSVALMCMKRIIRSDALTFGGAGKTVGAFTMIGGLLAGVITLLLGFALSSRYAIAVSCISFFAVLLVRLAVMIIADCVRRKRTAVPVGGATANDETKTDDDAEAGIADGGGI